MNILDIAGKKKKQKKKQQFLRKASPFSAVLYSYKIQSI